MQATELIKKLGGLVVEHGDLSVENEYSHELADVEFNDDDGACFLVTYDGE